MTKQDPKTIFSHIADAIDAHFQVGKPTNPKDAIGVRKAPMSTVPGGVLAEIGVALLEGAAKYGRSNYRASGGRASVYYDAAMRHMIAWWEGEDIDAESGLSHVTKAIASLVVLRDVMMRGNLTDDRPPASAPFYERLNALAAEVLDRHADKAPVHVTREAAVADPEVPSGPVAAPKRSAYLMAHIELQWRQHDGGRPSVADHNWVLVIYIDGSSSHATPAGRLEWRWRMTRSHSDIVEYAPLPVFPKDRFVKWSAIEWIPNDGKRPDDAPDDALVLVELREPVDNESQWILPVKYVRWELLGDGLDVVRYSFSFR